LDQEQKLQGNYVSLSSDPSSSGNFFANQVLVEVLLRRRELKRAFQRRKPHHRNAVHPKVKMGH
jgi:hypothetical protein